MSEKSQKNMKRFAYIIASVAFVAFVVLFFVGKVGDFIGFTSDTSSQIQSTDSTGESAAVSQDVTQGENSASYSFQEASSAASVYETSYKFRNESLLNQHYEKHGRDMGFKSAEEYEQAAAAVPNNPNVLHKTEKEDGDDVYYVENTNEFVIISTDGYIRTYFNPDLGIDYYNKQ